MSGEVLCRRATPQDAETLVQFCVEMARESEGIELDEQTVARGVDTLLQAPSKGEYFVGELAGKLVAQLMITYEWSDWRASDIWWIQSVYVHSEHRRKGIYRALYNHVKQQAKAAQASGLRLYADKDNKPALQTYEKLGMSSHYLVYEDKFTAF